MVVVVVVVVVVMMTMMMMMMMMMVMMMMMIMMIIVMMMIMINICSRHIVSTSYILFLYRLCSFQLAPQLQGLTLVEEVGRSQVRHKVISAIHVEKQSIRWKS